jgi:L-lactate dehydrogenase complex protein LldG
VSARDDILARIRRATGRAEGAPVPTPAYAATPLIPARGRGTPAELIARFVEMAEEASATISRVNSPDDVPGAVASYLAQENLPSEAVIAPSAALSALPWERTALTLRQGAATGDDLVSISPAVAGIAETGSLMVRSGRTTPYTLNFLPDTHVAVLEASDIVGAYEDAWAEMRPDGEAGAALPRTVTLITGPSRSSDIERTVTIGVHGPRRLHIVLVGEANGEAA